jgi:hypothetical protein
MMMHKEKIAM